MKRVLIVGSGGREHALAWKLSQEAEVFATPGNPGIASVGTCLPGDPLTVAKQLQPDLVVVGPENPLIEGLADRLRAADVPVFGPGADGAMLEASKAYAKDQMARAGVPTAAYQSFQNAEAARHYAAYRFGQGFQLAVKASGAALGKGVVVCSTLEEASDAIDMMMVDQELGEAGDTVVLEDRLVGREFSLLTVCSGTEFVSLPVAQDYKRALDGDRGPNTGGMGTYSPAPWVSDDLLQRSEAEVVVPLLASLASQGFDYRGVLFSGLMVVNDRPYCLEYNVRFGDPETQSVVRRLGSGFLDLLAAAASGRSLPQPKVLNNAAITVVLASGGYPGSYAKGLEIKLPANLPPGVEVFHAGTSLADGRLVTSGGRVLGVSAAASSPEDARAAAYAAANAILFEGKAFRSDIGL